MARDEANSLSWMGDAVDPSPSQLKGLVEFSREAVMVLCQTATPSKQKRPSWAIVAVATYKRPKTQPSCAVPPLLAQFHHARLLTFILP